MNDVNPKELIFTTGATGYVGGRLVPDLLEANYAVRCLAREPRKLDERPWRTHPSVEIVQGDMSDVDVLAEQLQGCSVGYYLVHSMEATGGMYAERDKQLASHFAQAAAKSGLKRIIYLGGLGEMGGGLSEHLRSRREVELMLGSTGVPVTTFRAAMIIGAGSASFEILRYLVERLPIMVTPSWVKTESQPVAITDVLHWLVRCLSVEETIGKTLEIGGPDVLPYTELMQIMAAELQLGRRIIFPLPVLTPRLSSMWISLVTPVSYRIARPLAEGLRNRVVMTNEETQRLMPHSPVGVREAIRQAVLQTESNDIETRWSAAGPIPGDPEWAGGKVFTDQRSVMIQSDPTSVFAAVCRIGGGNGWYAGDILWRIRGWMDQLVGGPGLRRGRRHPEQVEFGEALDFWRVVGIDRPRSLSLLAEMKLPGKAMLNFDLAPAEDGNRVNLTMTARFRPKGLFGLLYWYAVVPLHEIVFGGMLNGIRKEAEKSYQAKHKEANPEPQPAASAAGYGRARLWLGISAVGTMVTLATLGLSTGISANVQRLVDSSVLSQILAILCFLLLYSVVQLPFDIFGGYVLPKRYKRQHPSLGSYFLGLMRGVTTHVSLMFIAGTTLLFAGKYGGILGTVAAGLVLTLLLLRGRLLLASLMAPLALDSDKAPASGSEKSLPVYTATTSDEGFTGGVVGVFTPEMQVLPAKWQNVLGPEEYDLAVKRRSLAVRTGSWLRGRSAALLFTLAGLTISAWLVPTELMGTAGGVIELSLWFSLWSFIGLLTLPTLSRRGVIEVDERVRAEGVSHQAIRNTTSKLDDLQDGEAYRPPLIETIFHPIPSVKNRLEGPIPHGLIGCWDAARTFVYISMSGLGLLGRAVHCNCGRPSLWVFLPID
ncbi:MAG: DUF2867 domain-containing protein [Gemmataceae bacterium]